VAFAEADRSSSEADRAEAAAQSAATGVQPDTVGRLHLTSELRGEIDGKAAVSHDHTIGQVAGLQSALDGKASTSHTHTKSQITDLETVSVGSIGSHIVKRNANGHINVPYTPADLIHAASKYYVDDEVGKKADASHTHSQYATTTTVNALSAQVDNRRGVIHSGTGPPPSSIPGAVVGDYWLNETSMELYKITAV